MQTCPNCGRENAANAKFCVHCGASLAGVAAATAPPPQAAGQPVGQPGIAQGGYQPAYRAPRQPFTGNLQDHWVFVTVMVVAFIASLSMCTSITMGASAHGWEMLFSNVVLVFLFNLISLALGVMGVAGVLAQWRFLDWGRWFIIFGMSGFVLDGLLTLIAGGTNNAAFGGEGVAVAGIILEGIVKVAVGVLVALYMFSNEVASRARRV